MGKILENKSTFSKKVKKEFDKMNNNVGIVKLSKHLDIKKDLRNKFINSGSINDPSKSYHLEIGFLSYKEAIFTKKELLALGINNNICIRNRNNNKKYINYIKSGESILSFIKQLGAKNSYDSFLKNYNNKVLNQNINRKVNFETSNIIKAANAGTDQINDIKELLKKYRLKELDIKLQEVIVARKKYPELSLNELAIKIGDISKSALNHRFNKIRELAYSSRKRGTK